MAPETSWNALLQSHLGPDPAGAEVLDLHAGGGEHSLALARRGCHVTWIVPAAAAAAAEGAETERLAAPSATALRRLVAAEGLTAAIWEGDFRDHEPAAAADVVLAIGALSCLPRAAGASLLHRLRSWTRPGGLLVLTALHVDAPAYAEAAAGWRRIGLHSFRSPDGRYRTFLGRGEILDLMLGWAVLHHAEGSTADAAPATGLVELVARRPLDSA